MKAYLLALEIEPVETGRIYINLPLHCTVLHWFLADASAEQVLEAVRPAFLGSKPITLTSCAPDHFGPSKGPKLIPVNRLEPSIELTELHGRLYTAVSQFNIKHTEPYVLDNFTFHVSKQGTRRFTQGSTHLATTAYLVEALDPLRIARKQVKAVLPLGAPASDNRL